MKGLTSFSPITLTYPITIAHSQISDHWPCVLEIKTSIPKGRVFSFENCWMSHHSFMPLVASSWNGHYPQHDAAKLLIAKFICILQTTDSKLTYRLFGKTFLFPGRILVSF